MNNLINGSYNQEEALNIAIALSASMAGTANQATNSPLQLGETVTGLLPPLWKLVLEYTEETISEKINKVAHRMYQPMGSSEGDVTMGDMVLSEITGIIESKEFQMNPEEYLNNLKWDNVDYYMSAPAMAKVFIAGFLVLNNKDSKACLTRLKPVLRPLAVHFATVEKQLEHIRKIVKLK